MSVSWSVQCGGGRGNWFSPHWLITTDCYQWTDAHHAANSVELLLSSLASLGRERERERVRERERENREHQFQEQTLFFALSLFCSLFLVLFRPFCLLISLQHLSPSATDAVCFACFSFSFPCDNGAEQSQACIAAATAALIA